LGRAIIAPLFDPPYEKVSGSLFQEYCPDGKSPMKSLSSESFLKNAENTPEESSSTRAGKCFLR
jgi:hypothetical protein